MSYYLAIIGTKDTPIYELDFGTYRQGGDGQSRVGICFFVSMISLESLSVNTFPFNS